MWLASTVGNGEDGNSPNEREYAEWSAFDIVKNAIKKFPGHQIALVSSFGSKSAVLLNMVSEIDHALPILFLDTGKLFPETHVYADDMVRRLGLSNVRYIRPQADALVLDDPDNLLYRRDPDRCCEIRKVLPLEDALADFSAWINGRKGHHGALRASMPAADRVGPHLKVTPLHNWSAADVDDY